MSNQSNAEKQQSADALQAMLIAGLVPTSIIGGPKLGAPTPEGDVEDISDLLPQAPLDRFSCTIERPTGPSDSDTTTGIIR